MNKVLRHGLSLVFSFYLFLALSQVVNAASCKYEVYSYWADGFAARIGITNDTDQAIDEWEVRWSYISGNSIEHGWSAEYSIENNNGQHIVARNMPWNGSIAPGETVEFGWIGGISAAWPSPQLPILKGICSDDSLQVELDQNKQLWALHSISDYRIAVRFSPCFICEKFWGEVTVADGEPVSGLILPEQTEMPPEDYEKHLVDYLFALIQSGIDEGYDRIDVDYDPIFGFPVYIHTDRQQLLHEDEQTYELTDFSVLND